MHTTNDIAELLLSLDSDMLAEVLWKIGPRKVAGPWVRKGVGDGAIQWSRSGHGGSVVVLTVQDGVVNGRIWGLLGAPLIRNAAQLDWLLAGGAHPAIEDSA